MNFPEIKAVTSCSTHKITNRRQMVKVLTYDIPDHKNKTKNSTIPSNGSGRWTRKWVELQSPHESYLSVCRQHREEGRSHEGTSYQLNMTIKYAGVLKKT